MKAFAQRTARNAPVWAVMRTRSNGRTAGKMPGKAGGGGNEWVGFLVDLSIERVG